MVWFNVAVILGQPLLYRQRTEDGIRAAADDRLRHCTFWDSEEQRYQQWDEYEPRKWDNTEDYEYGLITCFDPESTSAILLPEGIWLDPGDAPPAVPITPEQFTELSKVYWERDEQKAKEELARLHALEKPLWDAREARWQERVREIFEKFKDGWVIWVRCHI